MENRTLPIGKADDFFEVFVVDLMITRECDCAFKIDIFEDGHFIEKEGDTLRRVESSIHRGSLIITPKNAKKMLNALKKAIEITTEEYGK
ncbi:hypothetical protein HNP88_000507 [Methanococcus maripaludis]|jgi:hypothetical protein|uniref:Uncharacterized protein n=2 Tax=Methanococcus maripaludis TaxID=39152 RepID=A0A7J9NLL8_METMI|nr:hypothetical protein [Methanococcus maripaludis]AEK19660.1 hypothetical protein GYY_03915 [Methanococcus maripaludis X1]MBA2846323.1 hypothetical protein [Methanococcus maripaludis]MBB6067609.1 hypothetical protein [Methanococcus maripaludis]